MTLLDLTRFALILSMELMLVILAIIDQAIWILAENMDSKQARQKATTDFEAATKFLLEEEQPRTFIPIPIRQTLYPSNTKPVAPHSLPIDSKLQEKEMRCPVLHEDVTKKRLFSKEKQKQQRSFIPVPIRQKLYPSNTKPVAPHSLPIDSKLQEKEMRCPVLHEDVTKKRLFSKEKQKQQRSFIPVPIRQKLYPSNTKPVVSQLPKLRPTVQEKKMPCQNMRCPPTFTSFERLGATTCNRKTNRVSAKPPVSAPTAVRRWRY